MDIPGFKKLEIGCVHSVANLMQKQRTKNKNEQENKQKNA